MTMTDKFKILGKYIKDLSSETPDLETYLYVKDRISKYQLGIDIKSVPLKNKSKRKLKVAKIKQAKTSSFGMKRRSIASH